MGSSDALEAIEGCLRTFAADEILVIADPDDQARLAGRRQRRGSSSALQPSGHAPHGRRGRIARGTHRLTLTAAELPRWAGPDGKTSGREDAKRWKGASWTRRTQCAM